MQISISARHGHLSEVTQEKIKSKVQKLARFLERLSSIQVTVDLEDEEAPSVDIAVSAEHKHDFIATDQSASLMGSIDNAVHKLEQQIRKYKEKVLDRHRQGGARHQEMPLEPESGEV